MDQGYVRITTRRAWHKLAAIGVVLSAATGLVALLLFAALVGMGGIALASSSVDVAPQAPVDVSRANYGDLGTETFEDTGTYINWSLTGHLNGPGWNFISAGTPYTKAHSGSRSIWFGDPQTGEYGGEGCDTCTVYSGTATFNQPVPIPLGDTFAYVSFWSYERTEMSDPEPGLECYQAITCTYDSRQFWILGTAPGYTDWQLKWDSRVNPTVENMWHQKTIDISEYIGQNIKFQFTFDTIDGRYNSATGFPPAGWFVDDIHLFTFTPSSHVYLPVVFKNR